MSEPQGYLIGAEEFPHGLRCMDCGIVLEPGTRYSERLSGFAEDTPIVEIVCVPCGLWGLEQAS